MASVSRVELPLGVAFLVCLAACKDDARLRASTDPPVRTSLSLSIRAPQAAVVGPDSIASSPRAREATDVEVVFGGDVVPQARVVAEKPSDLLKGANSLFEADGVVFNLEGPVGSRRHVPKDKGTLSFATPPDWLAELLAATHASALGVANNHACDLEADGVLATSAFGRDRHVRVLGMYEQAHVHADVVAEKGDRRVCALAWTTFFNDDVKKHDACRTGRTDTKVAKFAADTDGLRALRAVVSARETWEGCDARVAYVHGGVEYRPQSAKMMYIARTMAPYVDAIVFAHPHVPDVVGQIENGNDARRKEVPVFRSLGNLLSNQGAGWSEGMSTGMLGDKGAGDPIRTVWTRVAMLARLRFTFGESGDIAPEVDYGYDLAFLERDDARSVPKRLVPLATHDPIEAQLARGTGRALLSDRCRRDATVSRLPCRAAR